MGFYIAKILTCGYLIIFSKISAKFPIAEYLVIVSRFFCPVNLLPTASRHLRFVAAPFLCQKQRKGPA